MPEAATALLVTGASGFIGGHLVRRLLADRPEAVVVAQHSPGRAFAVSDPRVVPLPTRLADLGAALAVPSVPRLFAGVFHLAAYTPKGGAEEVDTAVIDANVTGLAATLAALEGRAERLLFASTLDVYGRPTGTLSEASPLAPESLYAASKVLGEVLVRKWGRRQSVPTAILRVGHVYGPGEDAYQKLIPTTIRAVLAGRAPVQYGAGDERRDFLYVEDCVALLSAALDALALGDLEPLNLVSGETTTVAEVIAAIAALAGGALPVERRALTASPRSFVFDATRLRARLPAFRPTSFADGLRAEVDWFRGRRPGV
jgi:UDP-glucose 4-epimerase